MRKWELRNTSSSISRVLIWPSVTAPIWFTHGLHLAGIHRWSRTPQWSCSSTIYCGKVSEKEWIYLGCCINNITLTVLLNLFSSSINASTHLMSYPNCNRVLWIGPVQDIQDTNSAFSFWPLKSLLTSTEVSDLHTMTRIPRPLALIISSRIFSGCSSCCLSVFLWPTGNVRYPTGWAWGPPLSPQPSKMSSKIKQICLLLIAIKFPSSGEWLLFLKVTPGWNV